MKWILASERLPEDEENKFVKCKSGEQNVAWYNLENKTWWWSAGGYDGKNPEVREGYIDEWLEETPSEQGQDGWISVEDGLPEYNVGVLVFIPEEDYHITSGMWDVSRKWVLLDEYRKPECKVTHWMKITNVPDEYKKEIEENRGVMKALRYLLTKPKDTDNSKP